jgi:DNA-binding XRE family transcriptional regulator
MSEYCKTCGTHISEDDSDQCAACAAPKSELAPVPGYDFAKRLRDVLESAGVSQVDLATRSGVSAMTINHFLGGRREPSVSNLSKLLKALWWCDARWLITGQRSKKS